MLSPPKDQEHAMNEPQVKNSYGLAFLALVGGAALTVGYAFAAIYIPLFIFGVIIPLGIALFLILLLIAGLRGSFVFRLTVVCASILANLTALWFASFWAHWGLDEAIYTLSRGPVYVYDSILHLSQALSYQFGEAKDVLRNSGFTITGVWLLILWGLEALAFVATGVLGFVIGRTRQDLPAGAGIRHDAQTQISHGAPVAKGLVVGTIKGLAQVALVFGVVYLIAELL
ncbi:hypothetical protein PGB28_12815 [Primorskyibacter aestuariivivens]|uniref:hypothetical protein n=1 Tax=Primorskyibacter aestuariivivens TaxID=1888912 RepID=UPI0022FFCF4E|nr:hypothetical protein [Primorskyibacter aestuariivivens]MDA7429346.1 hypothetical protein [Primorskyibacter aestuariivivens]